MSRFDIFSTTMKIDTERDKTIVRRIRQNVAHEVDALPATEGPRDKAEVDGLIARLRTLNAFLWAKLS